MTSRQAEARSPSSQPSSLAKKALVGSIVALLAGAYWWTNRPAGPYAPNHDGLYPVVIEQKAGFVDRAGRVAISAAFDDAAEFSEGRAAVRVGDRWGYIDTKGTVVITPQFAAAGPFRYQRASVTLPLRSAPGAKPRFGLLAPDGAAVGEPNFEFIGPMSEGLAAARTVGGNSAFVDTAGKVLLEGRFEAVKGFGEGVAAARQDGKWGFVDHSGTWTVKPQFEAAGVFSEGLVAVLAGGRLGFVDHGGRFVINPAFDVGGIGEAALTEFKEGRARIVRQGVKQSPQDDGLEYGFIDQTGRIVVEPALSAAGSFSGGLAAAQRYEGRQYVFIKPDGEPAFSAEYQAASTFADGIARVKLSGEEAYIDTRGALVFDPFADRYGITQREVSEVWDGDAVLVLVRKGTRISGYRRYQVPGAQFDADLSGEVMPDRTFVMTDVSGARMTGRFKSGREMELSLIEGDATPPSSMTLVLKRDAAAEEIGHMSRDEDRWEDRLSLFMRTLAGMPNSGARAQLSYQLARGFGLDPLTTQARSISIAEFNFREVLLAVSTAPAEEGTTPWGWPTKRFAVAQACQNCRYGILVTFVREADNTWRLASVYYPGD